MDDDQRKGEHKGASARQTIAIGKNTPLAITGGVLFAIIAAAVVVTQRNSEVDEADRQRQAQIATVQQSVETLGVLLGSAIEDVADRQRKYIGQGGTLTIELHEMHELIDDLLVWIAAEHGEVVP